MLITEESTTPSFGSAPGVLLIQRPSKTSRAGRKLSDGVFHAETFSHDTSQTQ